MDGQASLNEVINGALQAESQGIPVDWKALCLQTYNLATNHIANLEGTHEEDSDDQPDAADDLATDGE